jgi:phage terminase small subunit
MELKGRRELFCREYLAKKLNGTQAALAAGYSEHSARTEASQLLAQSDIQERVAELAAARNEKIEIQAQDVLIELLRMLTSDFAQAINEDGALKSIHDIPIDCRRMIAAIEVQETFEGSGKDRVWTGYLKKIKFWSKDKAIEMAARHLSLFNDKLNVTGLEELARLISEARERSVPLV